MEKQITIATSCYDRDWHIILSEGYIKNLYEKFNYAFDKRVLILNTSDVYREEVSAAAMREVSLGNIDEFYFTSDIKKKVLNFFNIKDFLYVDKFKITKKDTPISIAKRFYHFYIKRKGNSKLLSLTQKQYDCINYSISPLCAIYTANTDYLLYFTEDCAMKPNSNSQWITEGVSLMENNKHYIAARPIDIDLDSNWFKEYKTIDNFYITSMFTDRMFLVNADIIKHIDFNCENKNNSYPVYGRNGFESRVFNFMTKNQSYILISKNETYVHECDEYMKRL